MVCRELLNDTAPVIAQTMQVHEGIGMGK